MVVLDDVVQGSSSTHDHKYDVFLSFRGSDTRLSFTDHLHTALVNANITTFLDEQTGDELKPEVESAIKASRASVIVLSKNYASSRWCLDELVLILEQHRNFNQIVIPVFYHVEPTHVRNQQGSFGDAMAAHEHRMETETDAEKRSRKARKIELWKEALKEVVDIKGNTQGLPKAWATTYDPRLETDIIEEITSDIQHQLVLPVGSSLPDLIGVDYHIRFISSWLKNGSTHAGDILTIMGMGGIGKTSLAKYVYELHCRGFNRSSFIEDISRRCANPKGFLDVQKQLFHDISETSSIQVHDVSLYTSMIDNELAHGKVLLVLDDIDSLDQYALFVNKGFYQGSKIIITTQDVSLTENFALFNMQLHPKHTNLLLDCLSETSSLQLLRFHTFKCIGLTAGYKLVSKKLVKFCKGHPLAIKVLARSLYDRDVAEWEECVEKLKRETESPIENILRMSFDSLPSQNDKELFKHVACFFVGMDRDYTETILKACGIRTVLGIRNLLDRCLLIIGPRNQLMMHQLLQDMGRDVVHQESPKKPWKRSRLWCHQESFEVLKQKKGMENLNGLVLDMRMLKKEKLRGSFEVKTNAFKNMDNLMMLQLNYVQLNGSYENFPEDLRWLCMHGFPLKSIPLDLQMDNLVVLDMSYSNIESFGMSYSNPQTPAKRKKLTGLHSKDKRLLGSLKILDLSYCSQLRCIDGFCELPALEKLLLTSCESLVEISESIEQCGELVLVDLSYCNELRNLPKIKHKLKNVKTLLLDGCNLGELPNMVKVLKNINKNSLKSSSALVKALPRKFNSMGTFKPKSLARLPIEDHMFSMVYPLVLRKYLSHIDVNSQTFSHAIVEVIPRDFKFLTVSLPRLLVRLSLANNNLSSESFPMDWSSLSMLKYLCLDGNPIVSLPNFMGSLPKLRFISLCECEMLMSTNLPSRAFVELDEPLLMKDVFDPEMFPPGN